MDNAIFAADAALAADSPHIAATLSPTAPKRSPPGDAGLFVCVFVLRAGNPRFGASATPKCPALASTPSAL